MPSRKRVLIVFPTGWDERQLNGCRTQWEPFYEIDYAAPSDEECPWDLDVFAFIEHAVDRYRGRVDGVFSSSDYPGATVAATIAERLQLPGPAPQHVIQCSHKYYSRLAQRQVVPEATPEFWLIDPPRAAELAGRLQYPCFIKPVKGAFSIMSRRIESAADLLSFCASEEVREFRQSYVHIFDQLVERLTPFDIGGRYFLAEQLLHGHQTTVEGFCQNGRVHVVGIVDSIMHSHAPSFARFDYPSMLPAHVQARMREITRLALEHLQLNDAMFNAELIYNPALDSIHIIEINPRICGQFADLYEKVDGSNSYLTALEIACGVPVHRHASAGSFAVAASVPLRVFQHCRVTRAPDEHEQTAIESRFPATRIWSECKKGQTLDDFHDEDGSSQRYAVVNLGGNSPEHLLKQLDKIEQALDFRFEVVAET